MANGSSSKATVQAGTPATYNLQLNPTGRFTGTVALTCTGAPTGASCTASPATLSVDANAAVPFALNVTTTARAGAATPSFHIPRPTPPHPPGLPVGRIVLARAL